MWRVSTVALLVAAPLPPAAAQDYRGFYFGADLGQSTLGVEQSDLDNSFIAAFEDAGLTVIDGRSDLRDEDLTYSVTVGFQVFAYLALEAAWMDLGSSRYKASALVTDGVGVAGGHVKIDAGAKGPALSVLGVLPFADVWSLYARAGAMFADVNTSVRVESGGVVDRATFSDNSTELLYGVGLGYSNGSWTTRLDYQRVVDVGEDDTVGEADVDRIALSAIYRF